MNSSKCTVSPPYVVFLIKQLFLPCRGDDMEWRHLKLMGDLGKIHVHYFDPKVKESVAEAMQHSDVIVNCIGKRYETKFLLPFLN